MPTPFDVLQRAAFSKIEFLIDGIQIKGGIRKHTHEYPYTAGGQIEKLGRRNYMITMDAVFLTDHPLYVRAWPEDISALRYIFETETTDDLVIPSIGTIKACAIDWDQEYSNKMRNGERMKIVFEEDQDALDVLVTGPVDFSYQSVQIKADALMVETDALNVSDFFTSIFKLANEVQGLKDQVDLAADQIATKIDQLTSACQTLDDTLKFLNDPPSNKIVAALHDLSVTASNLGQDILTQTSPLIVFETPTIMTVTQLSTAIYGTTENAIQLLKMNPFEDALAIPQGFMVNCYAPVGP